MRTHNTRHVGINSEQREWDQSHPTGKQCWCKFLNEGDQSTIMETTEIGRTYSQQTSQNYQVIHGKPIQYERTLLNEVHDKKTLFTIKFNTREC